MRISDWSSDVCSSDLALGQHIEALRLDLDEIAGECCGAGIEPCRGLRQDRTAQIAGPGMDVRGKKFVLPRQVGQLDIRAHDQQRSEERRVGKDGVSKCRSGWSPYH